MPQAAPVFEWGLRKTGAGRVIGGGRASVARGVPVELAPDSVEAAGELVAVEDLDGTEVLHLVLVCAGEIAKIREMPGEVTSGELTMGMGGQWPQAVTPCEW